MLQFSKQLLHAIASQRYLLKNQAKVPVGHLKATQALCSSSEQRGMIPIIRIVVVKLLLLDGFGCHCLLEVEHAVVALLRVLCARQGCFQNLCICTLANKLISAFETLLPQRGTHTPCS